jgi:hypothetical protein
LHDNTKNALGQGGISLRTSLFAPCFTVTMTAFQRRTLLASGILAANLAHVRTLRRTLSMMERRIANGLEVCRLLMEPAKRHRLLLERKPCAITPLLTCSSLVS